MGVCAMMDLWGSMDMGEMGDVSMGTGLMGPVCSRAVPAAGSLDIWASWLDPGDMGT